MICLWLWSVACVYPLELLIDDSIRLLLVTKFFAQIRRHAYAIHAGAGHHLCCKHECQMITLILSLFLCFSVLIMLIFICE